jgi:hypothetical protein
MQTCWEIEVLLHIFLTSALHGGVSFDVFRRYQCKLSDSCLIEHPSKHMGAVYSSHELPLISVYLPVSGRVLRRQTFVSKQASTHHQVVGVVSLSTLFRCSLQLSACTPSHLSEDVREFLQTVQEYAGIATQLCHNRFLPHYFKVDIHQLSSRSAPYSLVRSLA